MVIVSDFWLRSSDDRVEVVVMRLLGVNIDHVATLRQARHAMDLSSKNAEPSLLEAANEAILGGADSITIHLREDRRHIQDDDVSRIRAEIDTKLNLEMGNTPEIVDIALNIKPDFVCLVPESREEVTTEGGLDVVSNIKEIKETTERLQDNGCSVSLFIDGDIEQVEAASEVGAKMIELHTGAFANAFDEDRKVEVARLVEASNKGHDLGLQVNAGHGINRDNVKDLFVVPNLVELNIGHHLVSRSVFVGLRKAVAEMRELMNEYSN